MKEEVGERIRRARVARSLTQDNMATELDFTIASYSNIERGVTDITVTRLFQIATILDTDVIDLLGLKSFANTTEDDLIYKNALGEQLILLSQQVGVLQLKIDQLENEVLSLKGDLN